MKQNEQNSELWEQQPEEIVEQPTSSDDAEETAAPDAPAADDTTAEEPKKRQAKPKKVRIADRRRLRYGGIATAITVGVIAMIVLLNVVAGVLADKYPFSFDTSDKQLMTLTEDSEAFAKGITQSVQIVVFQAEDTFRSPATQYTELNTMCKQFYSALKQYRALSGEKVSYSFVDLSADPTATATYSRYKVQAGSILFLCGDRSSVASIDDLFTLDENAYYYGTSPIQASKVEQTLALNIQKVTSTETKQAIFFTGHGEDSSLVSLLTAQLEKGGYTTSTQNITTNEELPTTGTVAVLVAPSSDYTADELLKLRTWIDNDGQRGRYLLYIPSIQAACPNLTEYMADEFGIEVTRHMAVETSAARVYGNSWYYTYADVQSTAFTSSDSEWVRMPMALQINTLWDNDTRNSKYAEMVVGFPSSTEWMDLDKMMAVAGNENATEEEQEAALQSYKADAYPMGAMAYGINATFVNNERLVSGAVVCGSMSFFAFLEDTAVQNREVLFNTLDGLTGNKAAVNIATQSLVAEKVDFGSTSFVDVVGLGVFTIGLPVLVLALGLLVYLRRRHL